MNKSTILWASPECYLYRPWSHQLSCSPIFSSEYLQISIDNNMLTCLISTVVMERLEVMSKNLIWWISNFHFWFHAISYIFMEWLLKNNDIYQSTLGTYINSVGFPSGFALRKSLRIYILPHIGLEVYYIPNHGAHCEETWLKTILWYLMAII